MKVLVKTPLSEYSGYGQDGFGLIKALIKFGADVYLSPAHVDAPIPQYIADILMKRVEPPFDLLIQHQDPNFLGLSPSEYGSADIKVGATMWEYSSFDNLPSRKTLRSRLRSFDLVLPYDDATAGCFDPYLIPDEYLDVHVDPNFPGLPIMKILQGGYDPSLWKKVDRDWNSERFSFCMVGALHARKDPFVSVIAFDQLKKEFPEEFDGARLHLKTNTHTLRKGMEQCFPGVRVHAASWPIDVLQRFYESQHVMVCPSRGEGKNLPPLEFATTGGTAIATNWGGHTQWIDDSFAYRLNYVLRPIGPETPRCMNARASVEHMKSLMWHTYTHRDEVRNKAEIASIEIPKLCSWDNYVERLMGFCCRLPEKGKRFSKIVEACCRN